MKKLIKHIIKKYLLILKVRNKLSPSVQIGQRSLYLYYRSLETNHLPELKETGFKVFSQFEEDGLLLYLFSIIGMDNKVFIEIGSDDGINSNSANLFFHFGWRGLFIDGNKRSINRGKYFFNRFPHKWQHKPSFVNQLVNRENINSTIRDAGYQGEIGLLSIDIDGNDYWIWDALDIVNPRVVIIETHNVFGLNNIVVPYNANYTYPGLHPQYHGASPVAMTKLANKKGYRLVGANGLGFNFIFVRNDIETEKIPEVSIESVLQHPSVEMGYRKFEEIKNWKYLKG